METTRRTPSWRSAALFLLLMGVLLPLAGTSSASAATRPVAVTALAKGVTPPPSASAATVRLRAQLLTMINRERRLRRLPLLKSSNDLNTFALAHAKAMSGPRRLSHSASLTRLCCFARIGENVGYAGHLTQVHSALMASTAHRSNILSRGFEEVGIGVVVSGGRVWVTEVFRDRR